MRARRKTSKITWAVLVFIIGSVLLFIWGAFFLFVDEPSGMVSTARAASFADISIPAEATNIRIAGWHQWMFYDRYMRFEAPTTVCLKTAADIIRGEKLAQMDAGYVPFIAESVRPGVFRNLSWFDLEKATNVEHGGGGPGKAEVWVDQDQGVFYWRFSD